jgi:hypothetical protein
MHQQGDPSRRLPQRCPATSSPCRLLEGSTVRYTAHNRFNYTTKKKQQNNLRASVALGSHEKAAQPKHSTTKYNHTIISSNAQTGECSPWHSKGSPRAPTSGRTSHTPSRTPDIVCDRAPRDGPQSGQPHTPAPGLGLMLSARPIAALPARASAGTNGKWNGCARCAAKTNATPLPTPAPPPQKDPSSAPPASVRPNVTVNCAWITIRARQQQWASGDGDQSSLSSLLRRCGLTLPLPRCGLNYEQTKRFMQTVNAMA